MNLNVFRNKPMIDKDREGVLRRFLETIAEISDKNFQERIWIKGIGPECSSFEEAICDFFDDGEPILKNYKEFGLTDKQYEEVIQLQNELQKYCDKTPEIVDNKEVLEDPEWAKIRKIAKEVLEAFNYKK